MEIPVYGIIGYILSNPVCWTGLLGPAQPGPGLGLGFGRPSILHWLWAGPWARLAGPGPAKKPKR